MRSLLFWFTITALLGCLPDNELNVETIYFRNNSFDVFPINIQEDSICFFWKDKAGAKLRSIASLKNLVENQQKELLFATNGGMYLEDGSPQGLYIENGIEMVPIDTSDGYGNFYMKPNGLFIITSDQAMVVESSEYFAIKDKIRYATQSGPLLLIDGVIHPCFNEGSSSKFIRSGVGIIDETHLVFAISNEPVNFYDFALFFQEVFGCKDALYLDGAISKMFIKETGRNELDGQFGCMIGVVE